jgi:rhomboid protease GluP
MWGTAIAGDTLASAPKRRFDIALCSQRKVEQGAFQASAFKHRGAIAIQGERVVIFTLRAHLFKKDVHQDIQMNLNDIFNVERKGGRIRFDVCRRADGTLQPLLIQALSDHEAMAIVALLPARITDHFYPDTQSRTHFLVEPKVRSPHAWATWMLVALNAIVFLLMWQKGADFVKGDGDLAIQFGSNFPAYILSGEWWRLVSSLFIHFGISHIFFNMLALVVGGLIVERLYGSPRFLALYFFSGLVGGLNSMLWHVGLMNGAGASGAIMGVFAALLAYAIRYRKSLPAVQQKAYARLTVFWIIYVLLNGVGHSRVDDSAHVGGLVGGFLMGWLLARPGNQVASAASVRRHWDSLVLGAATGAAVVALMVFGVVCQLTEPAVYADVRYVGVNEQVRVLDATMRQDLAPMNTMVATSAGRAAFASTLGSRILPELTQLQALLASVVVSSGSSFAPMREARMAYYDDLHNLLSYTKLALEEERFHDPVAVTHMNRMIELVNRDIVQLRAAAPRR